MVTLFNKTENGQFKCVEIVRDHNNNQVENMFLISISALLMVIGLAETQKPPGLAQTSLSSKGLPARNFQSQQSRNSQINRQTQASITYPDWDTWKRQFNKSYSPSDEAKAKQTYILNVMFMIENSFLHFNFDGSITQRDDISPVSLLPNNSYAIPKFEYDFLQVFKKNYNSASEKADRKRIFEDNVAIFPANTYWSDWTTDQFNSLLPAKLTTYKTGNTVTQRAMRKNDNTLLRSQTWPGVLQPSGLIAPIFILPQQSVQISMQQHNKQQPRQQPRQQSRQQSKQQSKQPFKQQRSSFQQQKQTARIPAQTLQFKGRI